MDSGNQDKYAEVKKCWDDNAARWDQAIGDEGDYNRIHSSDPYLFRHLGVVEGKLVLDAGCGTGYLVRKLLAMKAEVVGIDQSTEMIAIAKAKSPSANIHNASIENIPDEIVSAGSVDIVVSNYVLQDTPKYENAIKEFYRVLKPKGRAILIFTHPCFAPPELATKSDTHRTLHWPKHRFENSYFKEWNVPHSWCGFTDLLDFHRPLSHYFQTFLGNGFTLLSFEEPGDAAHYDVPCSVVVVLEKPAAAQ